MISEPIKKKMANYFDKRNSRVFAFCDRSGCNVKVPGWLESLTPALSKLDFMRNLETTDVGYVLFEARSGKRQELYVTMSEVSDADMWVSFRKGKICDCRMAWINNNECKIAIIVWSHAGRKYLAWDLWTPYSSPEAAAQATLKRMRAFLCSPIGGCLVDNDETAIEVFTAISNYDITDLDART